MAVFLHYAGSRFEIGGGLDAFDVQRRVEYALDRVVGIRANPESRFYPSPDFLPIEPWLELPLAAGGSVRLWCSEHAAYAVESDETDHDIMTRAAAAEC